MILYGAANVFVWPPPHPSGTGPDVNEVLRWVFEPPPEEQPTFAYSGSEAVPFRLGTIVDSGMPVV
jgi:hypothetical protein